MTVILETERLLLREFVEDDAEAYATDLGYRLAFDYWGRGIATESSLAVVRYGFETLGLEEITGLVVPENAASTHVLQKVGMHRAGTVEYFGERVQRWVLTAEQWKRS